MLGLVGVGEASVEAGGGEDVGLEVERGGELGGSRSDWRRRWKVSELSGGDGDRGPALYSQWERLLPFLRVF